MTLQAKEDGNMAVKPTVIKFFAPVSDATINALMNANDHRVRGIIDYQGNHRREAKR